MVKVGLIIVVLAEKLAFGQAISNDTLFSEHEQKDNLVLLPFEGVVCQVQPRHASIHESQPFSPLKHIRPSDYDNFLEGKMVTPLSLIPSIYVKRKYRLIWKLKEVINGTLTKASDCQRCKVGGGCCTIPSPKLVHIEVDDVYAKISEPLLTKMIGWTNHSAEEDEHFNPRRAIMPGKSSQLVFIPKMIRLRVMVDVCDRTKTFFWFWQEVKFECKPIEIKITIPLVPHSDPTKVLGKLFLMSCDDQTFQESFECDNLIFYQNDVQSKLLNRV